MSRVELPLVEPMYSTFHNQVIATSIIKDNETIRNWCLNESVMLTCTTRFLTGYSSPKVNVLKSSHYYCPYFEKHWFGFRFINGHINYVIKQLINEGYYICYDGVDDYYLEGKSWYKKRHFNHDGMIYGYDTEQKTYLIYAYDSSWVLNRLEIPIKSFDKGRIVEMNAKKYGSICGIKPTKDIARFNPYRALKNIRLYLDSSIGGSKNKAALQSEDKKTFTPDEKRIYGIVVHDYLIMYIDRLADGSIRYEMIDNRVFRLVWEHKKVMLQRVERLEKALKLGNECSKEYEKVVHEAETIRMLYASHCLKRRDSVLPLIRKKIKLIKDEEFVILAKLLKLVKRGKNYDALG